MSSVAVADVLAVGVDGAVVLLALIELAGGRRAVATTRQQVATLTGISRRRVGDAIARLHDAGLLRRGYGRAGRASWYRIYGLPTAIGASERCSCGTESRTQRGPCGTETGTQRGPSCGIAPRTQGQRCGSNLSTQGEKAACGTEIGTQGPCCGVKTSTQRTAPVVAKTTSSVPPTGERTARVASRGPLEAAPPRRDAAASVDDGLDGVADALTQQLARGGGNA